MNHGEYELDDLGSPASLDYAQSFLENTSKASSSAGSGEMINQDDYPVEVFEREGDVERHDSYLIMHQSSPFESKYEQVAFVEIIDYGRGEFGIVGDNPYFSHAEDILQSGNPSRTAELKQAETSLINGINNFFSRLVRAD